MPGFTLLRFLPEPLGLADHLLLGPAPPSLWVEVRLTHLLVSVLYCPLPTWFTAHTLN